jgi:hypothetical protein
MPERSTSKWDSRPAGFVSRKPHAPNVLHALFRLPWGGKAIIMKETVGITNTCSFDCLLYITYCMYKTEAQVRDFLDNSSSVEPITNALVKVFKAMDSQDATNAKSICINKIIKYVPKMDENGRPQFNRNAVNFHGSEESVTGALAQLFEVIEYNRCSNSDCNTNFSPNHVPGGERNIRSMITEQSINPGIALPLKNPSQFAFTLNNGRREPCPGTVGGDDEGILGTPCTSKIRSKFRFGKSGAPPFIVYCLALSLNESNKPREDAIPMKDTILGEQLFFPLSHAWPFSTNTR